MKRFASCLITLCLLITMSAGGFTVSAQQPKFAQKDWEKNKHPTAKRGASPEAKAAWDKATPEQRQQARDMLQARINEATEKVAREKRARKTATRTLQDAFSGRLDSTDADTTYDFTDKKGKKSKVGGKERGSMIGMLRSIEPIEPCYDCEPCYNCYPEPTPTPTPNPTPTPDPTPTPTPVPTPSGADADADGLPESFENQVADAFTPYYHVSGGEQYNFATFPNYPNQTPQQLLGPNPFSYFRVRPEGYFYNHLGQQVGALRVDYLTLWDYDGGLAGGCSVI